MSNFFRRVAQHISAELRTQEFRAEDLWVAMGCDASMEFRRHMPIGSGVDLAGDLPFRYNSVRFAFDALRERDVAIIGTMETELCTVRMFAGVSMKTVEP